MRRMTKLIKEFPKGFNFKLAYPEARVRWKPPLQNGRFSSSALMTTTLISASILACVDDDLNPTLEEQVKIKLCDTFRRSCYDLRNLKPEHIPDLLVNFYLTSEYKDYFIKTYQKHIQKLVEIYKIPINEALKLLIEYKPNQLDALQHLPPSEIADLNNFELQALIQTKKYGIKAKDIRYSKSITCSSTAATFIVLIKDYFTIPKKALTEVKDLAVDPSSIESINYHILNAISKGYSRNDIFLLLNGKSVAEVEKDVNLNNLFKAKLNYIIDRASNNFLFVLLQPLQEFTHLQQDVLQELYLYSKLPYNMGVNIIQTLSKEDLMMFATRKHRRRAYEKLNITEVLLHDKDTWFNTHHHIDALDVLINKQGFIMQDAINTLKPIQNSKHIECIALGATLAECTSMNEEQLKSFVELHGAGVLPNKEILDNSLILRR